MNLLFLFVFLVPLVVLASAVSFLVGVEGVGAGAESGGVSDVSATQNKTRAFTPLSLHLGLSSRFVIQYPQRSDWIHPAGVSPGPGS